MTRSTVYKMNDIDGLRYKKAEFDNAIIVPWKYLAEVFCIETKSDSLIKVVFDTHGKFTPTGAEIYNEINHDVKQLVLEAV